MKGYAENRPCELGFVRKSGAKTDVVRQRPAPGRTGGGSPGDTRVFICYAVKRLTYKTSFTSISDPARERPPADADPGTAHRSPSGTHPKVGGALSAAAVDLVP